MASTNKTEHYDLSQFVPLDKPAWLGDYNSDMQKIDAGIYAAQSKADSLETEVETASTAATAAQQAAQSATEAAQQASDKAQDAETTANGVAATASQALTTAQQAQTTAEQANTLATNINSYFSIPASVSYPNSSGQVLSGGRTVRNLEVTCFSFTANKNIAVGDTVATASFRDTVSSSSDYVFCGVVYDGSQVADITFEKGSETNPLCIIKANKQFTTTNITGFIICMTI